MAKNLLSGVNDVLQKVQIVSSFNPLQNLDDSGKRVFIDNAVASWNEGIDQIYSLNKMMRPQQACEDSIVLAQDVRDYCLADDLVQVRWPFHDRTNGRYIRKYPGGYEELRNVQVQPDNYTGQPTSGAISPIDNSLYIDRVPGASEVGDTYHYFYWKEGGLEKATDIMPFGDTTYRAMVPLVAELWRYNQNQRTSDGVAKVSFGRAARTLKQEPRDTMYIKRRREFWTPPLGHDPYEG